MSIFDIALLAFLGGMGAIFRHFLSELFDKTKFPFGILFANLLACALAAAIIRYLPLDEGMRLIMAGFVASLSTFSSMNYNIWEMLKKRLYKAAAAYFILTSSGVFVVFAAIV